MADDAVSSHCLMVSAWLAGPTCGVYWRWEHGSTPDVLESDPVRKPCRWASHGPALITAAGTHTHTHSLKATFNKATVPRAYAYPQVQVDV